MPNRGQLTPSIKTKMKKYLGRETTQLELRLLPYIQYVMVNERQIKPQLINEDERRILQKWREAGHIEGGAAGLALARDFWDFINDIVFDAYVAYDNEWYLNGPETTPA